MLYGTVRRLALILIEKIVEGIEKDLRHKKACIGSKMDKIEIIRLELQVAF